MFKTTCGALGAYLILAASPAAQIIPFVAT